MTFSSATESLYDSQRPGELLDEDALTTRGDLEKGQAAMTACTVVYIDVQVQIPTTKLRPPAIFAFRFWVDDGGLFKVWSTNEGGRNKKATS